MSEPRGLLFNRCPICGQGAVTLRVGLTMAPPFQTYTCNSCSAAFLARRGNRYELRNCSPNRANSGLLACTCYTRSAARCYLGMVLSRSRWEAISQGSDLRRLEEFRRRSESLSAGELPELPRHIVTSGLEDEEVVHYVSTPVYSSEEERTGSANAGRGTLILTNKRLIYRRPGETVNIPLENVVEISESFPGFAIEERGCFEPRYFFAPPLDPIAAAIKGALRRFSAQRA